MTSTAFPLLAIGIGGCIVVVSLAVMFGFETVISTLGIIASVLIVATLTTGVYLFISGRNSMEEGK